MEEYEESEDNKPKYSLEENGKGFKIVNDKTGNVIFKTDKEVEHETLEYRMFRFTLNKEKQVYIIYNDKAIKLDFDNIDNYPFSDEGDYFRFETEFAGIEGYTFATKDGKKIGAIHPKDEDSYVNDVGCGIYYVEGEGYYNIYGKLIYEEKEEK